MGQCGPTSPNPPLTIHQTRELGFVPGLFCCLLRCGGSPPDAVVRSTTPIEHWPEPGRPGFPCRAYDGGLIPQLGDVRWHLLQRR